MECNFDNIVSTFHKMAQDGFPIDDELKWGFYFVDSDKNRLYQLYNELSDHGYKLEEIRNVGNSSYQMHASKIERLAPDKLHRRNIAFTTLAEVCNVASYDGWDVENAS